MIKSKEALIDVSADNNDSLGVKTEGMLLCGVQFPAAMTGTAITFDFSLDNSTWVDVKETDGTDVSYTVSAGDVLRVDPSGWAFASNGYIRVSSNGTEAADRKIVLHFRHS
jgi:flagellar basal body rod protein FlgF